MWIANSLAGIAGIIAALFLMPRLVMVWMTMFPEPTSSAVLGLMAALVIVPGMVGGSAVAILQWLIGEFRKDRQP